MRYVLTVILVVGILAIAGVLDFDRADPTDDVKTTVSTSTVATSSSEEPVDPYADWQTYRSNGTRFELEHPPELTAETSASTSEVRFSNDDESVLLTITTETAGSNDTLRSVLSAETSQLSVVTGADIGTSTARVGGRLADESYQEVKILIGEEVNIARLTFQANALSQEEAAAILDSLHIP